MSESSFRHAQGEAVDEVVGEGSISSTRSFIADQYRAEVLRDKYKRR
jgi:hypothetical protein